MCHWQFVVYTCGELGNRPQPHTHDCVVEHCEPARRAQLQSNEVCPAEKSQFVNAGSQCSACRSGVRWQRHTVRQLEAGEWAEALTRSRPELSMPLPSPSQQPYMPPNTAAARPHGGLHIFPPQYVQPRLTPQQRAQSSSQMLPQTELPRVQPQPMSPPQAEISRPLPPTSPPKYGNAFAEQAHHDQLVRYLAQVYGVGVEACPKQGERPNDYAHRVGQYLGREKTSAIWTTFIKYSN